MPLANAMSKPANAVDIAADLVPAGRFMYSPMLTQFSSMGMAPSMPTQLAPYMSRTEYAAKMEEMNEEIRKLEVWFSKKKKYGHPF